ncbi:hypothetical protein, conserved [Eimeria maxima]|uniref:Protein HGH1 C-terminal domain-containing protein n=1 Tax=Eimeria maxima TaxID=5804 RepID=U6M810_EIMMA|nr:hypothetical protein, conserved [Eimeria maxima]CDJ60357.1 hypothetical protein, conserved [Eimeria maxima]
MEEGSERSYNELLQLLQQQQNPDVLLQVLQLLLQCSSDADFIRFLMEGFSASRYGQKQQQQQQQQQQPQRRDPVFSGVRRLLRLIGTGDGRLSAMSTEVLINLTANETLAALMLEEYKDMTSVLMGNLKQQQQQQQRQKQQQRDEDAVPLHIGVTLMLLSNVTRHKAAIDAVFSPQLPVPGSRMHHLHTHDYHLLPCLLLLHEAPRDAESAYWKEQGLFLLHILRNVTANDEAVEFLLRRRMKTVNKLMDLLRYLPPLCQAPFLLLALRLACREQLHPLLLPVDPNQLQQKVEQQYSQELQQQHQGEQLLSPEEDCRLLLALCCFLYPKPDSVQRTKARDELTTQDAEEDKQRQQEQQQQQHTGITERQRLRFLHPTVDSCSYGPAASAKGRSLAVDCLAALATSPHGRVVLAVFTFPAEPPSPETLMPPLSLLLRAHRETLRWFGVYEVLRAVFCIETEESIRDKVEGIVHLLVFSEEELLDQDKQMQQKEEIKPLCCIEEETQDSA